MHETPRNSLRLRARGAIVIILLPPEQKRPQYVTLLTPKSVCQTKSQPPPSAIEMVWHLSYAQVGNDADLID